MMKRIFVLFLILILSGCTVTTNLSIDNDYNVNEETSIYFKNSDAINYYTVSKYVNTYIDYYKSAIQLKKYEYKLNEEDEISSVVFTKKSSDICESINENLFSNHLFNTVKCKEEDNYFIIRSIGEQKLVLPSSKKTFDVNSVKINLKLPVAAEENNADMVKNNTYTWEFDKYSSSTKSIYIKINKDALEKKIEEAKDINQKKNTISKVSVIAIALGVILSLLVISYSIYKKAKSNRLEL